VTTAGTHVLRLAGRSYTLVVTPLPDCIDLEMDFPVAALSDADRARFAVWMLGILVPLDADPRPNRMRRKSGDIAALDSLYGSVLICGPQAGHPPPPAAPPTR
jgi:hypothetical protein